MLGELFSRGVLVGLSASITVGPVAVLCIQRTLSKSRKSGLASGVGVACADSLLATVAFFCYSMLKAWLDQYAVIMRVACGILVVVVGVYIYMQNPVTQIRRNRAGKTDLWQDFMSMFGFTLANILMIVPYIFVFFGMPNLPPKSVRMRATGGSVTGAGTPSLPALICTPARPGRSPRGGWGTAP